MSNRIAWLAVLLLGCTAKVPVQSTAESAAATTQLVETACGNLTAPMGDVEAPIVTDWNDVQRAELAAAMKRGVVPVAYHCGALHIVDGCTAPGHYGYIAVTPKTEAVHLDDADEAVWNLPTGGAAIARTTPTTIALHVAGRFSTIHPRVDSAELDGTCAGVTHFIDRVEVGSTANNCTSSETAPTAGCDAPLRLRLIAINRDAGEIDHFATPTACSAGRVWRDGKCAAPSKAAHQCQFSDGVDCQSQCDLGNAASCTLYARQLASGSSGVAKDNAKLVERIQQACKLGDTMACRDFADILARGDVVARDEARAATMFREACEQGIGSACSYLAMMAIAGKDSAANPAAAVKLTTRACDAGYALGCKNLAAMVASDENLKSPPPYWLGLFTDACTAGYSPACADFTVGLLSLPPGAADFTPFAAPLDRSCRANNPPACAAYATMVLVGAGVAKDEARATAMLRTACAANIDNDAACRNLGAREIANTPDPDKLNTLLEQKHQACVRGDQPSCGALIDLRRSAETACNKGNLLSCSNWAELMASGIGGDKDEVKARQLLKTSCEGHIEAACTGYSTLLVHGVGGPVDTKAALAILHAGCKPPRVALCAQLGGLLAQGIIGKPDERHALDAFETGCKARDGDSCESAGILQSNPDSKFHDLANAALAFDQGCQLGRAYSCSQQAAVIINNAKSAEEQGRGVELLRKSCAMGDPWGCEQIKKAGIPPK